MKLTMILLTAAFLNVSAEGLSQNVTLSGRNLPLRKVLTDVEAQTGYSFFYTSGLLNTAPPVSVQAKNLPVAQFLSEVFKDLPFDYSIMNRNVIIFKKAETPKPQASPNSAKVTFEIYARVKGVVLDTTGFALEGVTVTLKGTKLSVRTDKAGNFSISADKGQILVFTYVGMKPYELLISNPSDFYIINMKGQTTTLEGVVINTGVFKRNKESFTGAASTYTGAELKAIGNKNILESLKTLDPAFLKIENSLAGSNPNKLPEFEIRGRTSINTNNLNDQFSSDPNQPLFILDGFESTLKAIYDLDMNRVASVTILKDAASTALYGAKAANGVVVVETKRPVPGRLMVSYNADLSLDIPDLSSYNLMNASEKLQYEKLAGLGSILTGDQQWVEEERLRDKQAEVQRGVNTYWLNEPVQLGFQNRHSLQMSGGNNDLLFNAGVSYGNQNGVMKGSKKENWGANVNLAYRKGRLNIVNILSASGSTGTESPYGSYAAFSQASPYYRKQNPDGTINKYLDPVYNKNIINPLYNASLYSLNQSKDFTFSNNTQAILTITNELRVTGALQIGRGNGNAVIFIPPDNSAYDNVEMKQKGSYTNTHADNTSVNANMMVTWGKTIGKHTINANARGEMQASEGQSSGFSAVGFPFGTDGNPAFAYSYTPFTTPNSSVSKTRSVGFLGSFNYAYDRRYMMDLTYRLDGASVFGSSKLYKPFFSAGLAWTVSREEFFKQITWIDMLKLRGNFGFTGNENLGRFTSISTYSFLTGVSNNFGQGMLVQSLGNPLLDWQRTFQASYGVDFSFMKSRISGSVEYYRKKTDPLAIGADGTLPSSLGVNSGFVVNVGYLITNGWNFNLRYSPVYDLQKRIIWTIGVTGAYNQSEYGGFADKLATLNKQEQTARGLNRYYDGFSPDDVWAVVSVGVDPATGQEVFQKKDGSHTFNYSVDDIVRVGNTRPKAEGVINTSFTWHDFSVSANLRYLLDGYVFNNALYTKVENIGGFANANNLDKRALYDRWQKPGDIAQFTAIGSTSSPMSSRFLQKDSRFVGESFSLSWRSSNGWIRKLHLQSLGASFYLNDIFRIEKVLSERGIDYPYARTASLSINASF